MNEPTVRPIAAAKNARLLALPVTAVLTTLSADGSPHAVPVWFSFDGTRVLVSTRANCQKHRNIERDPRVSFTIVDPESPMKFIELRGRAEVRPNPTCAIRDDVVRKHGFADGAAFDPPGTVRVSILITAERILER